MSFPYPREAPLPMPSRRGIERLPGIEKLIQMSNASQHTSNLTFPSVNSNQFYPHPPHAFFSHLGQSSSNRNEFIKLPPLLLQWRQLFILTQNIFNLFFYLSKLMSIPHGLCFFSLLFFFARESPDFCSENYMREWTKKKGIQGSDMTYRIKQEKTSEFVSRFKKASNWLGSRFGYQKVWRRSESKRVKKVFSWTNYFLKQALQTRSFFPWNLESEDVSSRQLDMGKNRKIDGLTFTPTLRAMAEEIGFQRRRMNTKILQW